jgi:hypothetical protein
MSKFAIRLLTLAIYATAPVVAPIVTPAKAATNSAKDTKKKTKKTQKSLGVGDPNRASSPPSFDGKPTSAGY